jgi:hypothetical protein
MAITFSSIRRMGKFLHSHSAHHALGVKESLGINALAAVEHSSRVLA